MVALAGRVVVVKDGGEIISDVTSAPGSVSVTVGVPERVLGPDEFIPLPAAGERVVAVTRSGEHVSGRFLTADLDHVSRVAGDFVRVALLVEDATSSPAAATTAPNGSSVVRWVSDVPLAGWDALQCVRGDSAGVTVESLTAALAGQVRDRQAVERKRGVWLCDLVARAHDEANERDWCSEFDDFMESVGLDRRTREYELRVAVSATLYFTRESTNLDAAIDSIEDDDVCNRLTSGDISFDVEEDD